MAYISKRNRRREREIRNAAKNRREIIAARLSRRDMIKAGLLTSAGYLIQKNGLSARAQFGGGGSFGGSGCDRRWYDGSGGNGTPVSPPTTPFVEPLPIPPIAQSVASLSPAPTVNPNTAAGEARTRPHQALTTLAPQKFYEVHQREALISVHPQLPLQRLWTYNGTVPGQTMLLATANRSSSETSTIFQTTTEGSAYSRYPLTCTMAIHHLKVTGSPVTSSVKTNGTTSTIQTSWLDSRRAIHPTATSMNR